ncbi:hypothetical protein HDU67_008364, partial [Dinochytrium kinnereticum]
MSSKQLPMVPELPSGSQPPARKRSCTERFHVLMMVAVLALVAFMHLPMPNSNTSGSTSCAQVEARVPKPHANVSLDVFKKKTVKRRAYEHLSGAVKINTVSFDKPGSLAATDPSEDPVTDGLLKLHDYFKQQYPLIHANLERHVVNRHSLLFVWKGTNATAGPPLMLCSHMDTVPVLSETISQWTHEPWSGLIDEKEGKIWGRGSTDAKSSLVGIMEAVEILLEGGFKPQRTVLLAFGHDEEISGHQGAAKLSEYIMEHLGLENKVGMIVDEGSGIYEQMGAEFALVSIAEKGYYDMVVTVKTTGGHSSMPPDHTAIGMLSDAIVQLEANPHPLSLPDSSPFLQCLLCYAAHGPDIDPWLKFAIEHVSEFRTSIVSALSTKVETRYLMTTSQAVDIINGGHKVNALPEIVSATINHRIAFDSSPAALEARAFKLLKPVAAKHSMNITLFSADPSVPAVTVPAPSAKGAFEIRPFAPPLEPAPVSPSFGDLA